MHPAISIDLPLTYGQVCSNLLKDLSQVGDSGDYGMAFDIGFEKVLKVHDRCDLGYKTFIHFAIMIRSKFPHAEWIKHFPVVYAYHETESTLFIEMEKLCHYNLLNVDPACVAPGKNIPEAITQVRGRMSYKIHRAKDTEHLVPQYKNYKVVPSLEDALNVLLIEAYSGELYIDFHHHNILFRNGEIICPVITDPFGM